MHRRSARVWISVMAAMLCLASGLNAGFAADLGAPAVSANENAPQSAQREQAAREATQPLNNAPFWRDVREGEKNAYQTSQVRGPESTILVQTEGEIWRQLRNGPITVFGGWLLVAAFLAVALFYGWRGKIMLKAPRTGREIVRFSPWQRLVHWTTAIAFVLLAASGIVMLFGRYVVLPVVGNAAFAAVAIGCKTLHNFLGPLFAVCTVLMVVAFARGNGFRGHDWTWLRRIGDFLRGRHVCAGKYNAGEKIWFWVGVTLLGIVVSVTGLVLDFPNFGQGRQTMQIANAVHAVAAIGFMALAIGHIYLGTVGLEGSYDAMRHGSVDEAWAKEHHDIWYRQVVGTRSRALPGLRGNKGIAAGEQFISFF